MNKSQKLEMYRKILVDIKKAKKENKDYFMCWGIVKHYPLPEAEEGLTDFEYVIKCLRDGDSEFIYHDLSTHFIAGTSTIPEFYKQYPEDEAINSGIWFNSKEHDKRIEVIENIIKELEKPIVTTRKVVALTLWYVLVAFIFAGLVWLTPKNFHHILIPFYVIVVGIGSVYLTEEVSSK